VYFTSWRKAKDSGENIMRILRGKAAQFIALALALATVQVYAHADLVRSGAARLVSAATAQTHKGRLTTRGNNPVTVNGTSAKSGETIFSGQTIQTPDGVGATVQLPGLGRVDIAPNSSLTLTFENGKINVVLASGCLILTADKGVTGTLQAGGTSQQTDPAKGSALDVCSTTPGAAPLFGQGAAAAAGAGAGGGAAAAGGAAAGGAAGGAAGATTAATTSGGLFGMGTAGTLGFFGAAATITGAAILAPCRRGPNPSPGVPRGRNDECR
jgi:hypothetical protein